jgi:hypothetical protein
VVLVEQGSVLALAQVSGQEQVLDPEQLVLLPEPLQTLRQLYLVPGCLFLHLMTALDIQAVLRLVLPVPPHPVLILQHLHYQYCFQHWQLLYLFLLLLRQ